jgi:outer membrane protein assembly factor BamB
VFAGCSRGIVYALKASDGLEQWRARVGGPVEGGFAAVGDGLFMGTTNGTVLGVLWQTGAPVPWRCRQVGFPALGGPVGAEGNVIVGTDGGRALVIRPATGRVSARVDMPEAGLIRADPLVGDGCVYLGSTDGWVVACKLQDRQGGALAPLWQRKIGPELSAGPVIDRDYLYCGNGTRRLLALDRRTGRVVRRWEFPGVVRGSVAVAGGLVAAGTADGAVMAFSTPPRPPSTR